MKKTYTVPCASVSAIAIEDIMTTSYTLFDDDCKEDPFEPRTTNP